MPPLCDCVTAAAREMNLRETLLSDCREHVMLNAQSHSLYLLVSVNRFKGTAGVCWARRAGVCCVYSCHSAHSDSRGSAAVWKVLASLMRRRLMWLVFLGCFQNQPPPDRLQSDAVFSHVTLWFLACFWTERCTTQLHCGLTTRSGCRREMRWMDEGG